MHTKFLIEAHFVDRINCPDLHLSSLFLCTCQFSQDFVIVLLQKIDLVNKDTTAWIEE